jgi:hypothetical protein
LDRLLFIQVLVVAAVEVRTEQPDWLVATVLALDGRAVSVAQLPVLMPVVAAVLRVSGDPVAMVALVLAEVAMLRQRALVVAAVVARATVVRALQARPAS